MVLSLPTWVLVRVTLVAVLVIVEIVPSVDMREDIAVLEPLTTFLDLPLVLALVLPRVSVTVRVPKVVVLVCVCLAVTLLVT